MSEHRALYPKYVVIRMLLHDGQASSSLSVWLFVLLPRLSVCLVYVISMSEAIISEQFENGPFSKAYNL